MGVDMRSRVRDSVLGAISDDYESVELILGVVPRLDGLEATTPEQIYLALGESVKERPAQAHELSPEHGHATAVDINPDRIGELRFYTTAKGIAHVTEVNNRELTTES